VDVATIGITLKWSGPNVTPCGIQFDLFLLKKFQYSITLEKSISKIVIYATRFCVNWAFLIAREARLKYERTEDFKASRAIRKAQFAQKQVAYKLLLFETTSLKLLRGRFQVDL
jgi:hypothetical protein